MQTPKFAFHKLLVLLVSSQYFRQTSTAPLQLPNKVCQKAGVAILGAGVAGITTAQALSNASLTDFVILEYLPRVGGRVAHTDFGRKPDGSPYLVELGANWVQGLGTPPGPENPIWTLVRASSPRLMLLSD
ncbi:hypothetical protein XANCAGTX0491_009076 [Xanthoria calcicola]